MNSKKSKGCLIPFVLMLLVIVAFFVNFYFKAQKTAKENEINAQIIKQQQIAHQKKIDQLCVFPTGYAPTVSGYLFKIKSYRDYMRPFIDDAVKRAGKDIYQILPIKIDYKIKDNKCYVQGFSLSGFWDGKKIIPNFYHHYAMFPPKPFSRLDIEVTYGSEPFPHGNNGLKKGKKLFWLKHYKNLYFALDKYYINKHGYYTKLYPDDATFYVSDFQNYGMNFYFFCAKFSIFRNNVPVPISTLVNRQYQPNDGCLGRPNIDRNSAVFFDGGSISTGFDVHVLSDIVFFLNSLRSLGLQFTVKGEKQ